MILIIGMHNFFNMQIKSFKTWLAVSVWYLEGAVEWARKPLQKCLPLGHWDIDMTNISSVDIIALGYVKYLVYSK